MSTRRPSIEVGVSTMHQEDPAALCRRLGLSELDVRVLIINQCPDGPLPDDVEDGSVRMFSFGEQGVSLSRNRAIELAQADVLVFADDDIAYPPELCSIVEEAFTDEPAAAVITFQVLRAETGEPTRRFPRAAKRHTPLSITGVGTIEIAVRPAALGSVRFDERFGLGASLPQGDEPIFLCDAMRAGLNVHYWPMAICSHKGESSGGGQWPAHIVHAKGAVLRRMYPRWWPAFVAGMWCTKYRRHGRQLGIPRWTYELLRGAGGSGAG